MATRLLWFGLGLQPKHQAWLGVLLRDMGMPIEWDDGHEALDVMSACASLSADIHTVIVFVETWSNIMSKDDIQYIEKECGKQVVHVILCSELSLYDDDGSAKPIAFGMHVSENATDFRNVRLVRANLRFYMNYYFQNPESPSAAVHRCIPTVHFSELPVQQSTAE